MSIMKRHIILFLLLALLTPGFAQQPDSTRLIYPIPESQGDPMQQLYNQSPLYMRDPNNITHEVTYDPTTNQYTFKHKVGDFEYTTPTTMSQQEYFDYKNREGVMSFWKDRRKQNARSATDGNSIIPPIYIGGKAFDMIFGSNTIEIRPQGSVDLSFGIKHNYRGDPSMSERQKHNTNFDFDQDIQLNVTAKIGDKITFTINKNTKATFNFQDLIKLKYEGTEDEILQLLEAGDVSLPLNSTLITGTQRLFGLKSKLKFGKTTVTSVVSYQESESKNISVQGGAQTSDFNLSCLDYEENRHFFLSQYFRDQYETALATLPTVNSSINITRIEVWVTNTNSTTQDTRNIIALNDLAEGKNEWIYNREISPANTATLYPRNAANNLLTRIDTSQIRNISTVTSYMSGDPLRIGRMGYMTSGRDFEKIENARRLSSSEYSLNSKLGFISLNVTLNSNQTLAVAYQYTIVGSDEVYQVGEFSDQGISAPNVLVAKLLRGTTVNPSMPIWDLMMKNVYNIKAYQISSNDFMLNIFYTGNSNNTPMGYFTEGPDNVKGVSLLHLLGLDNLTQQNNPIPGGDGVFDFINGAQTSGGTINSANGRIYFPVLEPFGSQLRKVFADNVELADKYAFDSLYTMTKTSAEQYSEKNKFSLRGYYSSQSGSEISLNVMNVAQGSVTVTAGGRTLVENVDYTVDYTLGRVAIINEGILNSGTPINISLESNSGFSAMKKTFLGARIEHEFNQNFHLGGTILYLGEKSYTQKINYGEEAIANTIYGFDLSYNTEARWLTNFIDWLPGISTKAPSRIRFDGEFARFIPGLSKSVAERGTSYIDDFEGAKSTIDLRLYSQWHLASTPQHQNDLFPEAAANSGLSYGMNRAKMSWYTIDHTVFYDRGASIRPKNITNDELSKHSVRQVLETEIFTKDIPSGTPTNISVLNLAYFPKDRGPYNYDVTGSQYSSGIDENGLLNNPESRWAGIMRKMETTDFEATNIEYIEFWMMDPFADPEYQNNPGKLYINLGDISEDVLRDGRKFYENGMPETQEVVNVDTTIWGRVPIMQDIVGAFSTNSDARQYQDIGYDGLRDDDERSFFQDNFLNSVREEFGESSQAYQKANNDPSSDNYHYFRSSDWDNDDTHTSIVERYKSYNGTEGNSPSDTQRTEAYTTNNTTLPDGEDINSDNTLSESERYYQYEIDLDPTKMEVGKSYIADIYEANNIALANGQIGSVKWYQFRVPVRHPDKVIGSIEGFSSIRFMRMFVREFANPVVLRFATLDLVKGEWRTYTQNIQAPGEYLPNDVSNGTTLDVSAVNIEENGRRSPVPYVIPPGIAQEQIVGTTAVTRLNEQSLQMLIQNLVDGDGRAIYKTTDFDLRQYKYLKMFVHAEKAHEEDNLEDQDLTVFIRLGSDFTENYYEYEIPLKITPWYTAATNKEAIWPEINNFDILLEDLVSVKENRNAAINQPGSNVKLNFIYAERFKKGSVDGKDYYHTVKIIGNPTLSNVEAMMVGVRNPKRQSLESTTDDGQTKSVVVWINELRLTDLSSKGGFAGTGHFEATLADLGRFVVNGTYSSGGFGALDSDITDNTFEANSQFNISTDLELGKFIEKTGVKLPLHIDYGKNVTTPIYNPYDPDVKLNDALAALNTPKERDSLSSIVHSMTQFKNINLMNVRKERTSSRPKKGDNKGDKTEEKTNPRDPNNRNRSIGRNGPKAHFWDIENFNLSFSYSETNQENPDINYFNTKTYRGSLGYNFVNSPKNVTPFAKAKWASSPYLAIIKDINFYYLPKNISFSTDMNRFYSEKLMRNKSGGEIIIKPTISKQWDWNRNYQFRFDLTKGLSFEYAAQAQAYIYEPAGNPDKGTEEWKLNQDTIKNELKHLGSTSQFHQTVNLNYNIPINKLPFLSWVTANATYQGQYFWTASAQSIQDRLGNNIENSNSIQAKGDFDLNKIYNSIPYLKKLNQPAGRNKKNNNDKEKEKSQKGEKGQTSDSTKMKPKINYGKIVLDASLKLVTMVKKVSVTYSINGGQNLPGYMEKPDYFGLDKSFKAPGLGFVLGFPGDIYTKATTNGWVTTDSILSSPYVRRSTETFNYRVNAEPFSGFKIDIQGNMNYAENFQQYFRYNNVSGQFEVYTPTDGGNFTSSTLLIKTAFANKGNNNSTDSPLYDQMLANRPIIADRIAKGNPQWIDNVNDYVFDTLSGYYFPRGYYATSPEVLLYSFLAAYSGQDANTIKLTPFSKFPLPNWTISYNGLSNIPAIGAIFKTVNITHSYKSTYTISNWGSNVNYDPTNTIKTYDNSDAIIPRYDLGQLVLSEQFMPLIGVDLGFNNSLTANVQYKTSRTLTMSFSNNQLTEVEGNEIVVGAGYRIKGLTFNIVSLTGNKNKKTVKNDLVLKLDIGLKRDKTTLRRIDENNSQVSSGQSKLNVYLTGDYQFSTRLSTQLFFKYDTTTPFVSTSFPTSTTFAGLTVRFSLAQ